MIRWLKGLFQRKPNHGVECPYDEYNALGEAMKSAECPIPDVR